MGECVCFGTGLHRTKVAGCPVHDAKPEKTTCCVVIYPADQAGRVSYLYGVFEDEPTARRHYHADGATERVPPEFLNVPLYPADERQTTEGGE